MLRKIEAMHAKYGTVEGHCRNCCNYVRHRYHDSILRKCRAYGLTHSEASDWAGKYLACGLFNRPFNEAIMTPIMFTFRYETKPLEPEPPIDGQMTLEGCG